MNAVNTAIAESKVWTKAEVAAQLKVNPAWQLRALVRIYERQTADEQAVGATVEHNKVGFNGADAEILSSFARQYIAKLEAAPANRKHLVSLSVAQMELLAKKIVKYAGQIASIANGG